MISRRSLLQRVLSAAAGCVLARTAFVGPRVAAGSLETRISALWDQMEKCPPLEPRVADYEFESFIEYHKAHA